MRASFVVIRVLGAAAVVVAIVVQLNASLAFWARNDIEDTATQLVNFFSFFTIQSNLIACATLAIGAVLLIRSAGQDARWFAILRACATTYMVTTGVVYNLLLRGIELPQGHTVPWTNEILHVGIPLVMLLDWLLAPGRRRLGFGVVGIIVIYPIVWAAYTMIRGPFTANEATGADSWYPYPFLNPDTSANGYLSVAFYVLLIAVLIGATGAGVVAVSKKR